MVGRQDLVTGIVYITPCLLCLTRVFFVLGPCSRFFVVCVSARVFFVLIFAPIILYLCLLLFIA